MRVLALILGLWHAANGVVMLVAPSEWYAMVPDVADTGPANVHFIRDIGLAFLGAGLALIFAFRNAAAVLVACVFLCGHALLHLVEFTVHGGSASDFLRDALAIGVPAFLPLALLKRSSPK